MKSLSEAVRRGELHTADCPSRDELKHASSLWGVLCLLALRGETLRFSELRRRATGVSEKMLAQTLKRLEKDGLVERVAHPVVPPHVEYSLTSLGQGLTEHVAALADWIEFNLPEIMAARRATGDLTEPVQ
ncbi:MAG TPA: helix-turn-helix domain-containing protein [Albidovulum sp.]|uniref:winged helix-turn-helix transcriptional regulator n=1 Tax=Albidovulum sp. TaxID=1872424 RepID=UPI002BD27548|nr:helix-turn-helix domain-containing protein [Albidovulum sp.]